MIDEKPRANSDTRDMKLLSLKIGTRGSPLALAQAHETRARLARAHGWTSGVSRSSIIRTSGDMIQDRALAEAGGKGLFTKEIDAAMLGGRDRRRRAFVQGPSDRCCPTASSSPASCRARMCATR